MSRENETLVMSAIRGRSSINMSALIADTKLQPEVIHAAIQSLVDAGRVRVQSNGRTHNYASNECLIVESDDGKRFTAYAETGERLCSDTNYDDCVIKIGLLGRKMNPVPPNSWAADRIREKIDFYGGPKNG